MLIFKIVFSVYGNNFYPQKCINELTETLNVFDSNSPDSDEVDYGSMSFMHPKIFEISGNGLEYEEVFINFFKSNHEKFIESGVDNFEFFTEVYYSGEQCNFEIFNKSMLERIYKLNSKISLPVSVYHLKKKEIKELLDK